MKSTLLGIGLLAVGTLPALFHAPAAQAGSLDNAALACFVDTYAYDQLTNDYCASVWFPGSGNRFSTAYFEVSGVPAGSYTYSWTPTSCGSGPTCTQSIFAQGTKTATVTIHDNATGENRTVSAEAEYIDGYD